MYVVIDPQNSEPCRTIPVTGASWTEHFAQLETLLGGIPDRVEHRVGYRGTLGAYSRDQCAEILLPRNPLAHGILTYLGFATGLAAFPDAYNGPVVITGMDCQGLNASELDQVQNVCLRFAKKSTVAASPKRSRDETPDTTEAPPAPKKPRRALGRLAIFPLPFHQGDSIIMAEGEQESLHNFCNVVSECSADSRRKNASLAVRILDALVDGNETEAAEEKDPKAKAWFQRLGSVASAGNLAFDAIAPEHMYEDVTVVMTLFGGNNRGY